MFTHSNKIFSLALVGAGLIFAAPAQAGHKPYCREVVQTVKIGGFLRISEYGTACSRPGGSWYFVSEHPHPRRYGNGFYFQERGRLIPAHHIRSSRGYFYNDHHHKYLRKNYRKGRR